MSSLLNKRSTKNDKLGMKKALINSILKGILSNLSQRCNTLKISVVYLINNISINNMI